MKEEPYDGFGKFGSNHGWNEEKMVVVDEDDVAFLVLISTTER